MWWSGWESEKVWRARRSVLFSWAFLSRPFSPFKKTRLNGDTIPGWMKTESRVDKWRKRKTNAQRDGCDATTMLLQGAQLNSCKCSNRLKRADAASVSYWSETQDTARDIMLPNTSYSNFNRTRKLLFVALYKNEKQVRLYIYTRTLTSAKYMCTVLFCFYYWLNYLLSR